MLRAMRIDYLDGERLRRSLIAGCEYVQERRSELNRINVFPVPDGDTGTNLALTASAIADRMRSRSDASVGVIAAHAADAAILGARGNCGMILSHFLLGFSEHVRTAERLDPIAFANAMNAAVSHVYRSLEKPVEGTIVTVMREVAEEAVDAGEADFADLIELLLARAKDALERTPDLLPQLKAAGVVDAGAYVFVHLMVGIVAYIHGDPFVALKGAPVFDAVEPPAGQVAYPTASERYRFCTEALVRGAGLPDADTVRAVLRDRGDSLIVIRGTDIIKVHVHTDDPEDVFVYLRGLGELVTHKAEDMQVQHAAMERAAGSHVQLARRPMSIVADSACNLPDEVVRAHGMHIVPMWLVFDNEVLRDGVDIDADTFVKRLRAGEHPTTSQPAPAEFLGAFQRAAEDGETVLGIIVSSALSGTFASAEAAAKRLDGDVKIRLVDSRAASLTQGLLALHAAELAEVGRSADEIVAEIERIRDQSGIFFTVEVFDNLLASGRIGRGKVMIAGLLDIRPVLTLDEAGRAVPLTSVRGAAKVLPKMLDLIAAKVPSGARALRFGVIHVGRPAIVAEVTTEVRRRFGNREVIVAPATPVLATHLGPGAWGLAWQWED
jgi:DegV family protein with EDD domain